MTGTEYDHECIDLEMILRELEENYKDGDDDLLIDKPLGYLRAILSRGEAYRKDLYGIRVAGMSKFTTGDVVRDIVTEKVFDVTTAHVDFIDGGYTWVYRKGGFWIPESDLELVVPRK